TTFLAEMAPPNKRGLYSSFVFFSAAVGILAASAVGWLLTSTLTKAEMADWGWRIPFVASALLVGLGLWVRLNIHETPDFKKALERKAPVRLPMWTVLRDHPVPMLLGTLGAFATFV
ncbi:MFS transporter, partial [Klebsiella pneumoniae]|uniref:MFS transporter n=1 Tax=Klebsiella pneumoniae TaxID=573 RepID=UPI0015F91CF6